MRGRIRFAQGITRLINGENRLVNAVTALCLAGAAVLAGIWMAQAARGLRVQVAQSEIVRGLTAGLTQERLGMEATGMEPERAASFLSYLNAMAPAVLNLEISPEVQLNGFHAIYDAGQGWGVALREFAFDEEAQCMRVTCTAADSDAPKGFYEQVRDSGRFSRVEFGSGDDMEKFTITCAFS